jgi:hypothetical protein
MTKQWATGEQHARDGSINLKNADQRTLHRELT